MSSARSSPNFGGKKENMKRQNGLVRAAYDAFLLHELQVAFGALPTSIHPKKPIHGL